MVKYIYVRNLLRQPIGCIAYTSEKTEDGFDFKYGTSFLHENDTWSRVYAKKIASGRLAQSETTNQKHGSFSCKAASWKLALQELCHFIADQKNEDSGRFVLPSDVRKRLTSTFESNKTDLLKESISLLKGVINTSGYPVSYDRHTLKKLKFIEQMLLAHSRNTPVVNSI